MREKLGKKTEICYGSIRMHPHYLIRLHPKKEE